MIWVFGFCGFLGDRLVGGLGEDGGLLGSGWGWLGSTCAGGRGDVVRS